MSVGLPILSSLQGETKALLEMEEIGVTYNPIVKDDLIKKINKFLDRNVCTKMRQNSQKLFDKKFSSKIVYNNFRDAIEKVGLSSYKEKT